MKNTSRATTWALVGMFALSAISQAANPASFDKATNDPGRRMPSKSLNGKSLSGLKDSVKKEWDSIVFTKDGKPVEYQVTLETNQGDIVIEFFPDKAPNHARSFIALAKAGYYDGLLFHRVIPGFMVQGGCPIGDGTGGPGYQLNNEFNDIKHTRGILSAARARDPNSAGSQFFIMVATSPHLDGQYTAFGKVVKGMDVADKIVGQPRNPQDRPLQDMRIKKATVSVKK